MALQFCSRVSSAGSSACLLNSFSKSLRIFSQIIPGDISEVWLSGLDRREIGHSGRLRNRFYQPARCRSSLRWLRTLRTILCGNSSSGFHGLRAGLLTIIFATCRIYRRTRLRNRSDLRRVYTAVLSAQAGAVFASEASRISLQSGRTLR